VNADLAEGASLGVRGTPTFFIDGYPFVRAAPYETFQYPLELAEQGKLGQAYLPSTP
jgi:protein-disulfide isomerase